MRKNWTRQELVIAYNGYCKIPYGRFNNRSAEVNELAKIIGRSPGAVAFKLVNFVSLDPKQKELGRKGATNVGKLDKLIFEEFQDDFDKMYLQSELLIQQKIGENKISNSKTKEIDLDLNKKGETILRTVKNRKNQDYFRKLVMTNYSDECAITGIQIPILLIASHIKPWSIDEKNRLNPQNGICLSATFDKAFDRGLVTINKNYEVVFSKKLKSYSGERFYIDNFKQYENKRINLPIKFLPKQIFLDYHNLEIFKG